MEIKACKVEDLGTAPNWSGSITSRTAGTTNKVTTKSSATLEIEGVREMGLRCLFKSVTGFCFGSGITFASFQEFLLVECTVKHRANWVC